MESTEGEGTLEEVALNEDAYDKEAGEDADVLFDDMTAEEELGLVAHDDASLRT